MICSHCKKPLEPNEAYEYRGAISCDEHFDLVVKNRTNERHQIMEEEDAKLKPLKGMDLDPRSPVGRANREILAPHIEIASKESGRMKRYERSNK